MEVKPLRQNRGRSGQRAAVWLLALSGTWNVVQAASINSLEAARMEAAAQLFQTEQALDSALNNLDKMTNQEEQMRREPALRAMAYEAVDAYQYIGECTVTAYCPCEECCGQWADGLTATGIPAEPGIVAVDPEIIPIGATVVIDGQRYLAADTGVTGLHVDVCAAEHREAEAFGVRTAEVWVERKGGQHG